MTATIVDADEVRNAMFLRGDEEKAAWARLLDPDHVEMTVAHLTTMAVNVNNDLAVRGAGQVGYSTDHADWRRRALGFKRAVDRHLVIAKATLKAQNRHRSLEESVSSRNVLRELAIAVLRHQRASATADINAEPHDVELWQALDLLTVPVADDMFTLRHLITEGTWT